MDNAAQPTDLFPPIKPHATGHLDVGGGHSLYWEEVGNPKGQPVVFLHGGPGAGAGPAHRRFFDPDHWRIILFDQRGAGRSRPHASIENNTTPDLIADLEQLRRHFDIDRWLVFGGSWGATLALAYGIEHPDRCTGLVLRGVFLGRTQEMDWFLNGMGRFFPEARRAFVGFLPEDERADPLAAYHRRLMDPDPAIHGPAAAAWNAYETACSVLVPDTPTRTGGVPALHLARIEAHYFQNAMFLEDDHILKKIDRLADVPGLIVQGRYDVICPPETAEGLSQAWSMARLVIVADAGHSAMEPGIRRALVGGVATFKDPAWPTA